MSEQLLVLASGLIVPFVKDFLVKSSKFPWVDSDSSAGKIKALVAVLAAIGTVLTGITTHNVTDSTATTLVSSVFNLASTLGISALLHHWFLAKKGGER